LLIVFVDKQVNIGEQKAQFVCVWASHGKPSSSQQTLDPELLGSGKIMFHDKIVVVINTDKNKFLD
jgi:hypothetical protein